MATRAGSEQHSCEQSKGHAPPGNKHHDLPSTEPLFGFDSHGSPLSSSDLYSSTRSEYRIQPLEGRLCFPSMRTRRHGPMYDCALQWIARSLGCGEMRVPEASRRLVIRVVHMHDMSAALFSGLKVQVVDGYGSIRVIHRTVLGSFRKLQVYPYGSAALGSERLCNTPYGSMRIKGNSLYTSQS